MRPNKWAFAIIMAAWITILFTGCSMLGEGTRTGEIDPPPGDTELKQPEDSSETSITDPDGETMEITGYFEDPNGFVAPLTFRVPYEEGTAKATLEYMVEGGPGEALLPEGFRALIPQGTQITMNVMADKTAVVDFSENFTSYNPQDERKILEAVTWALTEFDSIDRVAVWVNGEPLEEMPANATPLDAPLTRAMGINLERVKGVDYGQSTPVTLFFQSSTLEGQSYFVPVTRMIARTDNVALAALNELIRGPLNDSLYSVISADAEVLEAEESEGVVTVNLDSAFLADGQKAAPESLQSVVLSLTETTGAEKVQIMVNGSTEVIGSDDQTYNTPVSRPARVNKIEL